ncbi:unnamed protein product [Meloidogyne enterolobii]|uniref:Uncharacterized protein n=1 Tax=Meloidogyne enterolobii TaxID=390850 RepID=A0ACB1AV69_MELEN
MFIFFPEKHYFFVLNFVYYTFRNVCSIVSYILNVFKFPLFVYLFSGMFF